MPGLQDEKSSSQAEDSEQQDKAWRQAVARRLRELVGNTKASWGAYMKETGVKWDTIQRWLRPHGENSVPPPRKLCDIARVYNLSLDYLLGRDGFGGSVWNERPELEKELKQLFPQLDEDIRRSEVRDQFDWDQLSNDVCDKLGEQRVWVLDADPQASENEAKAVVANFAQRQVLTGVTRGKSLGLTGGTTVHLAARRWCQGFPTPGKFQVYSLEADVDHGPYPVILANEIVKYVANHFSLVDAFFPHRATKNLPAIRCEVSLAGVGALGDNSPLVWLANKNGIARHELLKAGAVADFLWTLIDINGEQLAEFEFLPEIDRIKPLDIREEMVRKGKIVYAVGVGDHKAEALRAYLQGGLVNGLIVTADLATEVVKVHNHILDSGA